jgi:diguanylate cyclase (GGDEF)-like protein
MNAWYSLENQNKLVLLSIGIISVILLGIIDYFTGYEASFALFYLLPVSFVAWFTGKEAGFFISIIAAATWHLANSLAGELFSNPLIPYWNAVTRLVFFVVVTFTLSRLKLALEHARSLSRMDHLTGVANSRAFYDIASVELSRARRYRHTLTVSYIDLDNFKYINDHFGHNVGDVVLRMVGQTILRNLRSSDTVARLGGDEFAILFPETGSDAAQMVLYKIQGLLTAEMQRNAWPISFSIGAVTYVEAAESVNKMIQMADDLMYVAKRNGKNLIEHKVL